VFHDKAARRVPRQGRTSCSTTRPHVVFHDKEDYDDMKLKLDLHDIYNKGGDIDRALRAIIDEAVAKKAPLVEIIPGKGSGALKKHVLRFLDQKEIKALYHRVEKDSNNFGRVFVHFRWK
jgi:DNA-nicking Smr family endonuclease